MRDSTLCVSLREIGTGRDFNRTLAPRPASRRRVPGKRVPRLLLAPGNAPRGDEPPTKTSTARAENRIVWWQSRNLALSAQFAKKTVAKKTVAKKTVAKKT